MIFTTNPSGQQLREIGLTRWFLWNAVKLCISLHLSNSFIVFHGYVLYVVTPLHIFTIYDTYRNVKRFYLNCVNQFPISSLKSKSNIFLEILLLERRYIHMYVRKSMFESHKKRKRRRNFKQRPRRFVSVLKLKRSIKLERTFSVSERAHIHRISFYWTNICTSINCANFN